MCVVCDVFRYSDGTFCLETFSGEVRIFSHRLNKILPTNFPNESLDALFVLNRRISPIRGLVVP